MLLSFAAVASRFDEESHRIEITPPNRINIHIQYHLLLTRMKGVEARCNLSGADIRYNDRTIFAASGD